MAQRLNKRVLEAIDEALSFRTAGPIEGEGEDGAPSRADYEAAEAWTAQQLNKRKRPG